MLFPSFLALARGEKRDKQQQLIIRKRKKEKHGERKNVHTSFPHVASRGGKKGEPFIFAIEEGGNYWPRKKKEKKEGAPSLLLKSN